MHRIDTAGNVANRFTRSNPQVGQRATVIGADWPNAVQDEICTVIEQAGIDLDKGASDQLYLAILELVSGVIGGGGGAVPTTRLINAAGLLTGGGALATDRNLAVAKASGAEIAAGTEDGKAITPAGLVAAMASVKTTTGYTKLFNGLILQWGVATALANSTTVITLPTTFPNACFFAGVEGGTSDGGAEENNPFVSGRGTGSISVFNARDANNSINWLAFGH